MKMLRTKLPVVIVLLVIFSILISGVLTYSFSSQMLLRKSQDEIKANAYRTGEAIHGLVSAEIRATEILASQSLFRETLAARRAQSGDEFFSLDNQYYVRATKALQDAFAGSVNHEKYWLGDEQGVVIAGSEEEPEIGDILVPDRPYFMEAMRGRSAVSGTITSRANGKFIIVVAAPVRDENGEVIGVMGNSIYTSFFSDHLDGIKVNERGKLYIVDGQGMILAHSTDQSLIKTRIKNRKILDLLKLEADSKLRNGTLEFVEDGVQKYIGYSQIPKAGWVVIVEDDLEDITSPLSELSNKFFIVLFTVVAVSLILLPPLLSRWVTRPLHSILSVMTSAGEGNLNAKASIRTKDEFGILGKELNKMLGRIKELMKERETAAELQLKYVAERERSQLSEKLRIAMQNLTATLDVEEVRRLGLEELRSLIAYDRASVWSFDNRQLELVVQSESNHRLPSLNRAEIHAICEKIADDNQPVLIDRHNGKGCVIAVPFYLQGHMLGIKVLERLDREFDSSELELLLSYCSQVVIAVMNAVYYSQMEKMASTDELTGLHNRRFFYKYAQQEWEETERLRRPLAVILFDIDYFKQVNDRYGHFAGDEVLRSIRTVIEPLLPEQYVMARFGGEEFVLLLPGKTGEEAGIYAEQLRVMVSEHRFYTEKGALSVTISLGAAERRSSDTRLDQLLQRADEALYEAKEQGRNQVIIL